MVYVALLSRLKLLRINGHHLDCGSMVGCRWYEDHGGHAAIDAGNDNSSISSSSATIRNSPGGKIRSTPFRHDSALAQQIRRLQSFI